MAHTPMLRAVLALCIAAVMLHTVAAGYTPCSDPAVCPDPTGARPNTCCTDVINGGQTTTYCCPGDGNSFDLNTKTCANFAQCGQFVAAVAHKTRAW